MSDPAIEVSANRANSRYQTVAGSVHTAILLLIFVAITWLGYVSMQHRNAAQTPLNHLVFYVPTILWEWLVFAYIYWGVRKHGREFRDIAGDRWKNAGEFFRDVALAFGAWIVSAIVVSVASRLLHSQGMVDAARRLAPRGFIEDVVWIALAITAGICEETIFRGYLQRQFVAWFRNAPVGVLISAILFGAGHIYQGVRPAIVIIAFGLVFGILAELRKNLRPGMMMHAWQDGITGFLIRVVPK